MSDNLPKKRKGRGGPSDLQDAWQILANSAPVAARTLRHISKHGQSEPARVTASKTILEMTGFGGRDVVPVRIVPSQFDPTGPTSDGRISSAQIVRDRMAQLRASEVDATEMVDPEIVDAELVDPDQ
jgi:hypothetical protein